MPFIDSRQLSDEEIIERDIVIVGSGPAGIAVAREFIGGSARVALVESGDLGPEQEPQQLAKGTVVGLPYPDLSTVRLRAFGGTTWHWGGNVRPLEPMDFAHRPWIADSGWPITADELAPYYAGARSFFRLPEEAFDRDSWSRENGRPWQAGAAGIESQIFHTVGEPGLYSAETWGERLRAADNIALFYQATVLDIRMYESLHQVREVVARTPEGKRLRFRGRQFVLAAGGIETPRILLLAASQKPAGLGNDNDLVGRYFQEHLTLPDFARLIPSDPQLELGFYLGSEHDWGSTWGILRLSDLHMRRHRLANVRFQLAKITNAFNEEMDGPGLRSLRYLMELAPEGAGQELGQHIANVIADIEDISDAAYYRLFHHPNYPIRTIDMVWIGEQLPNPESRVRLGDDLDPYGQRRVVFDWRVSEADNAAAGRTAGVLMQAFLEAKLGRLLPQLPEAAFAARPPKPHLHHMGTTRMHGDPRHGVVDRNCRVHGLENLYIAGSSVFPTSGNANPTYTIVALAIRLADHLKEALAE